jgi:hypothetical protein
MKLVSLSAFFAGSLLLFTGAQSALACSFFVLEHQVDPSEVGVDTTAPEVVIDRVRIQEGVGSEQNGACGAGRTSCYDIGTITIEIGTISDDRTPAEEMGYRVEIDGDFPGDGLSGMSEGMVIRADNGVLYLNFIDPDPENKNSWDFSLRVIAVDLAGNESEPSRDFSFEQEAGCRADDGGADQAWLFAPFVPWLWSRRRRSEASDDESEL